MFWFSFNLYLGLFTLVWICYYYTVTVMIFAFCFIFPASNFLLSPITNYWKNKGKVMTSKDGPHDNCNYIFWKSLDELSLLPVPPLSVLNSLHTFSRKKKILPMKRRFLGTLTLSSAGCATSSSRRAAQRLASTWSMKGLSKNSQEGECSVWIRDWP